MILFPTGELSATFGLPNLHQPTLYCIVISYRSLVHGLFSTNCIYDDRCVFISRSNLLFSAIYSIDNRCWLRKSTVVAIESSIYLPAVRYKTMLSRISKQSVMSRTTNVRIDKVFHWLLLVVNLNLGIDLQRYKSSPYVVAETTDVDPMGAQFSSDSDTSSNGTRPSSSSSSAVKRKAQGIDMDNNSSNIRRTKSTTSSSTIDNDDVPLSVRLDQALYELIESSTIAKQTIDETKEKRPTMKRCTIALPNANATIRESVDALYRLQKVVFIFLSKNTLSLLFRTNK